MNESHQLPEPWIVPWQMREARRWCQYALVPKDGGGFSKMPHAADGDPRVIKKPQTWVSLPMALLPNRCTQTDGVGFITGDDFVCVDLDNCLADDGTPSPLARQIVDRLGSFTEISLSGKGLHIWARGSLPPEIKSGRWETKDPATGRKVIEVKGHGCYVTFSGNHMPGTPAELVDVSAALARIIKEHGGIKPAEGSSTPLCESAQERPCDNATLLYNARRASNGPKFSRLYDGEPDPEQDAEADESVDDQRLLSMLYFWTKGDREWAFELFMESARGKREKVMNRGAEYLDYGWQKLAGNKVFSCDYTMAPSECVVEAARTLPAEAGNPSGPIQLPDDASQPNMELIYADALTAAIGPVRTVGTTWFCYEKGCWVEYRDGSIFGRQAFDILPAKFQKYAGARSLLSHIELKSKVEEDLLIGAYQFDAQGRVLLNTRDAVLRVCRDHIEQLPHDPAYGFARQTVAGWDPTAEAPSHARLLDELLQDPDDRRLFWQCMGNALMPDCRHEIMGCFFGQGGCGKGSVMEPISAALGDGIVSSVSLAGLCGESTFQLPQLGRSCLNLATEVNPVELDDTSVLKTLTSGEPVSCCRKGVDFEKRRFMVKHIFLCNDLPKFRNGSMAELRRLRFLDFGLKCKKPDTGLKSRLRMEAQGVFRQMVESLQDLLRTGEVGEGGARARQVKERFSIGHDPVAAFITQHCVMDPNAVTANEVLRNAWNSWRDENAVTANMGALSSDWFSKKLKDRFPSRLRPVQRTIGGTPRTWCTQGIGLVNPDGNDTPEFC